jgi:hypothetical protein
MRFPHPVACICVVCGQPTVTAETPIGTVRVHCGTWRWQCDLPDSDTEYGDQCEMRSISLTMRDEADDQELAA